MENIHTLRRVTTVHTIELRGKKISTQERHDTETISALSIVGIVNLYLQYTHTVM